MSWAGITNENEFFSHHYVAEVFARDIKGQIDAWLQTEQSARAAGTMGTTGTAITAELRTPYNRLASLSRDSAQYQRAYLRQRSSSTRLSAQRTWTQQLAAVLDLPFNPKPKSISDDLILPLLGEVTDAQGEPLLWVLEAIPEDEMDADPLSLAVHTQQVALSDGDTTPLPKAMFDQSWQMLLAKEIFTLAKPPRWVILAGPFQWLLLERSKFAQNRLLRFDWPELLSRRETETLKAASALLHRDALLVEQGASLLDTLDESAHKHAYGVSEDLKYALRECIELLGNEAAEQLVEQARTRKEGIFSGKNELDPDQLSRECLRYMYRLLFLFYIEARPELGYAPIDSEVYLHGYSLESLRRLEMVELASPAELNGRFINDTLDTLFRMIDQGFVSPSQNVMNTEVDAFELPALKSHLFDPNRTALLNKVIFPNHVLLKIIRLMSLSRPGSGARKRRGRISYGQLGINQLGAVYEALLSFRGFFATEDLYEVKKAGDSPNALETGYFVNAAALENYDDEEKVYDRDEAGHRRLRKFSKGRFIYRMAGRDRQKSASYYTPEVLTRSLVKYALQELYKEQLDPLPDDAARADRLLKFTVCEPAMGSAAFLNEAINQLADKYLALAQSAKGERISQNDYAIERQKVKMYLADRNVFGVDLNPVAVELAEVSIWLNALSSDRFVPWLGLQLHCGNSLIGARREFYRADQLRLPSNQEDSWLSAAPEKLPLNEAQEDTQIWHFLLPFQGMTSYNDEVLKQRYKPQIDAIKKWRNQFTKPFSLEDIERLQTLSAKVELLWQEHAQQLAELRTKTTDEYNIYGAQDTIHSTTSLAFKDNAQDGELLTAQLANASCWRRLKLVMDYWCALWFWPIQSHQLLPSREEWLFDLENLLLGDTIVATPGAVQSELFAETISDERANYFVDKFGVVDLKVLFQTSPRYALVDEVASKQRFFHWYLDFADIFRDRAGFDLVLGNPPWVKVEWEESGVLGDVEPAFVIRKTKATKLVELREETFESYPMLEQAWRQDAEDSGSTQEYLNAKVNYPDLAGQKANLYKCFLPVAWNLLSPYGISGYLHPEGVFDEPHGGRFREVIYSRIRWHFQFQNERKLFPIGNRNRFGLCIYGARPLSKPSFGSISNLFSPKTIDECLSLSGEQPVGGIKRQDGSDWNDDGHPDRIIRIGLAELELFAKIYDESGTPAEHARLPAIHARQLLVVLAKFDTQTLRLADFRGDYYSTQHWNEVLQQNDGTIRRETKFPSSLDEWVLSGPHFYVGTSYAKTPKRICNTHKAYENIDLMSIANDYLPRTNYVPSCSPDEYQSRTPKVSWIEEGETAPKLVSDYYRCVNREMIGPSSERTMITSIVPPRVGYVNTVLGLAFKSNFLMLDYFATSLSILVDFRVKSTGMGHANISLVNQLPVITSVALLASLRVRALGLVCLTEHFKELWDSAWNVHYLDSRWASKYELGDSYFSDLQPTWSRDSALRSDFGRRQALVEIDVLVAQGMRVSLEELLIVYRVQFPVLRQYENETFYDQNGRIIFTPSRSGVGLPRRARTSDLKIGTSYTIQSPREIVQRVALGWEDVRDLTEGVVSKTFLDDTMPGGPHERTIEYVAPFFKPDREEDYRVAWAFFENELGEEK